MKEKLKKITLRDVVGTFKFAIVLIPSIIYKVILKLTKKELWLICETENTARDNGFVFYGYMKKKHPEIKTYYAISKKCNDYKKVKKLGDIVEWSSFKHYFIYMSSTKNISSHKEGNPNQTIFTILHLYLNLYNNRVFLQHGVLYQNHQMFHQKNTKFKIFICGAKDEYKFVKEKYGYNDEVKYTGLARFDNLHNCTPDSKMILYMPTWRRWIEKESELFESNYYKKIVSFLNSSELNKILEKNDKYLYFCPHFGLKEKGKIFKSHNSRVKIINIEKADIQELLKMSSMLITDYSSVHTDFAYMNKRIVYYQYDEKEFKEKHVGKAAYDTYFDYKKQGFGTVVEDESELLTEIKKGIEKKFRNEKIIQKRIKNFFELYDTNNCKRIFEVIYNNVKK